MCVCVCVCECVSECVNVSVGVWVCALLFYLIRLKFLLSYIPIKLIIL